MLITKASWTVSLRCTRRGTKLLVTDTMMGEDLMKARLPNNPVHPRALMTLCEGLALWHGLPLCVAVSADEDAQRFFERVFYGDGLVEPASPLVMLEARPTRARSRTSRSDRLERGLGDFRQLRLPEHDR
jgi:hypothetical protein